MLMQWHKKKTDAHLAVSIRAACHEPVNRGGGAILGAPGSAAVDEPACETHTIISIMKCKHIPPSGTVCPHTGRGNGACEVGLALDEFKWRRHH